MIVLVLGNGGTGKTHYITHYLYRLAAKNICTLHTHLKLTELSAPNFIDKVTSDIKSGHVHVFELNTDLCFPQALREHIKFIVFTSICAFEHYFCKYDTKLKCKDVIEAIYVLNSPRGKVTYDVKAGSLLSVN